MILGISEDVFFTMLCRSLFIYKTQTWHLDLNCFYPFKASIPSGCFIHVHIKRHLGYDFSLPSNVFHKRAFILFKPTTGRDKSGISDNMEVGEVEYKWTGENGSF